jgi:YHS domain-containing protein/soluble P-type ATPase/transposase-like protein
MVRAAGSPVRAAWESGKSWGAGSRVGAMTACPTCHQPATTRDGFDRRGRQRFACSLCHRHFTHASSGAFSGYRWPPDVIVTAVRWYLSYPLSARQVTELLAERGIDISARTVLSWTQTFGPPLATAVRRHRRRLGRRWYVDEVFLFHGAAKRYLYRATVDGRSVLIGNPSLLREAGIETADLERDADRLAAEGKTPLLVGIEGKPAGVLAVADTMKEESGAAVVALQKLGLEVVMITGDNRRTAAAIARQVGIGRVLAEVLPDRKAAEIKRLQSEGRRVAMVGDGINDAPALAQADVGMAIGTGTDVAIEASDITLISGALMGIVTAIHLSRATMRNIRQNLVWAFGYNVIGIPIAAGALYPILGLRLSPMIAAGAMALSSLSVVSNANRLRGFRVRPAVGGATEPTGEPVVEVGSAGPVKATDPVCGMEVKTEQAAATIVSDGTRYYFCSTECRDEFVNRTKTATEGHGRESGYESGPGQGAQVNGEASAIDPVCGMTVDVSTAEYQSVHQDVTHYFCSAGCKTSFDRDPDKYMVVAQSPNPGH